MGQALNARSDLRDCGLSVLKALLRTGDRIPETYGERSCQEISNASIAKLHRAGRACEPNSHGQRLARL